MTIIKGKTPAPDLPGYGTQTEPDEPKPETRTCCGCGRERDSDDGGECIDCSSFICFACHEDAGTVRCGECYLAWTDSLRDAHIDALIDERRG